MPAPGKMNLLCRKIISGSSNLIGADFIMILDVMGIMIDIFNMECL